MEPVPDRLNTDEAAKLLGVHPSSIRRWQRQGRLLGDKVGKNWRFARAAVLALRGEGERRAPESSEEGEPSTVVRELFEKLPSPVGSRPKDRRPSDPANLLLANALACRATHVHLEPERQDLRVRYRVEGELVEVARLEAPGAARVLLDALKRMSGMAGMPENVTLDGRVHMRLAGRDRTMREVSICVSITPSFRGAGVVLTLYDPEVCARRLDELPVTPEDRKALLAMLRRRRGLVAVTSPRDCGATELLYALLREAALGNRKAMVMVRESGPLLEGIHSQNPQPWRGLDPALLLRGYLRQDPDVIMIEEIDDAETREVALRAARDRCLVLAGFRASHVAGLLDEFRAAAVPDPLFGEALLGAVATRWVAGPGPGGSRVLLAEILSLDPMTRRALLADRADSAGSNLASLGFCGLRQVARLRAGHEGLDERACQEALADM